MKGEKDLTKKEWTIKPGATNVIDLSYPMEPGMTLLRPIYPDLEYKITEMEGKKLVPDVDDTGYPLQGFYARFVTTGPNGLMEGYGTHVEASSHAFGVRGLNIDQYPLSAFIGPGVVINIADKAANNHEYNTTVDDLLAWEKKHDKIPDGAIVILNNGWGKYWGDYDAFFGVDKENRHHYPGISPEACQWLINNRKINAIGTDAATIDGRPQVPVPGYPKGRTPHGLAREITMSPPHHLLNIEYLANVDKLPERGSLVICAPINFVGGYAGVARCLGVLP